MVVGVALVGAEAGATDDGVECAGELAAADPASEEEECEEEPSALACDADEAAVELGVGTVAGTLTADVEVLGPDAPSPPVAPVPLPEELFVASAATLACVSFSLCPASEEVSRPPPDTWTAACVWVTAPIAASDCTVAALRAAPWATGLAVGVGCAAGGVGGPSAWRSASAPRLEGPCGPSCAVTAAGHAAAAAAQSAEAAVQRANVAGRLLTSVAVPPGASGREPARESRRSRTRP